jgi:iron complex outermembrane receptor protein
MLNLLLLLTWHLGELEYSQQAAEIPEITVISRRSESTLAAPASIDALGPDETQPVSVHPNQLLDAGAAAWVTRGSGQEHLTALRSPVLTGAGACGAFLYLENGVPIRPPGFCNINNLFELNLEQAARVEVLKGPGSAMQGSNALHGMINAMMPEPTPGPASQFNLLLGEQDYRRFDASYSNALPTGRWRVDTSLGSSDSFRDQENYAQQKLNLRYDRRHAQAEVSHQFAATNLNQETAGFILGFESYRDPDLRTENLNPEAFRDAHALRAVSHWRWPAIGRRSYQLTPFVRSSRMDFLQHFLPGKPLEENGQDSVGMQFLTHLESTLAWDLGVDIDYADGFLRETQDQPTEGSPFLMETRPAGKHYDYQVDSLSLAVFARFRWDITERWQLQAGVRLEQLSYEYDNRMLDGNSREDGTICSFGGCLYNRPADRDDSFTNLAPKIAMSYQLDDNARAYLRLARGYRAPQATELYRLQRQQSVADIKSERLDAVEIGFKHHAGNLAWSADAFYMSKDHFIFRDADGFNVSDGRTRHRGVEAALDWQLSGRWQWRSNLAYARHSYAFSRSAGSGEQIQSGNLVDTAPKWLGRSALDWQTAPGDSLRLEWVHQGGYFLDAANAHRYSGHDLFHLGWRHRLSNRFSTDLQLNNLGNTRYAERADFAFGNYRYFPGEGRTVLLAIRYQSD